MQRPGIEPTTCPLRVLHPNQAKVSIAFISGHHFLSYYLVGFCFAGLLFQSWSRLGSVSRENFREFLQQVYLFLTCYPPDSGIGEGDDGGCDDGNGSYLVSWLVKRYSSL